MLPDLTTLKSVVGFPFCTELVVLCWFLLLQNAQPGCFYSVLLGVFFRWLRNTSDLPEDQGGGAGRKGVGPGVGLRQRPVSDLGGRSQ